MAKRTILVFAAGALFLTFLQGAAMAGHGDNSGYDPLYWNGPEGSGDYNILFRRGSQYSKARYRISSRRACAGLLRKYRRSGSSRALRRYHRCKARYN